MLDMLDMIDMIDSQLPMQVINHYTQDALKIIMKYVFCTIRVLWLR